MRDLPQFLQPIILKLLDEGCEVLIKGSAAYPKSELTRIPGDLDLEILVKGMSGFKNTQIRKFTSENFGLKVNDEDIRRFTNKDGSTTLIVNFTDPILHNLDISLYDPDHLPLDHLSWITSKERKIKFANSDSGEVKKGDSERVPLGGFENFLSKKKSDFNPDNRLIINSKASEIVFRLCFLEAVGQLTEAELSGAIPSISPYDPRDLLAKNLRLKAGEDPREIIQKEIAAFAESRRLSEEEYSRFLESLSRLVRSTRKDIPPQFRKMCAVIEELKNSKPSNSLNANSAASLGAEKAQKESR